MKIVVNGKELEFNNEITIEQLLVNLEIEDKVMAVAVNMEIVKKDNWSSRIIKEDDKIELLHFVGGGWFTVNLGYNFGSLAGAVINSKLDIKW